jgi:ATP-dependent DNA ligase
VIVRREGPTARLYSRNPNDWTARLSAIAAAAARIKAKSFTIDGEAVVLGPNGYRSCPQIFRACSCHPRKSDRANHRASAASSS